MLPTKFEQIYLRLIWKGDTSAEVYREMLMEFSKIKGKGICVYLYEKIFILEEFINVLREACIIEMFVTPKQKFIVHE